MSVQIGGLYFKYTHFYYAILASYSFMYRTRVTTTHSWFETADFFEEFPSLILKALDYKPQWKMG